MQASQFIAAKFAQFQLNDGSLVNLAPGDEIPGNAILQNPHQWIKHGFIVHKEGKVVADGPVKSTPARVSTVADKARGRPGPLPEPGAPIPSLMQPQVDLKPISANVSRGELEELSRVDLLELSRRIGLRLGAGEKKAIIIDSILEAQQK